MTTKRSHTFSEEEKMALLQFVQEHNIHLIGKAGRPGHGDKRGERREAKYWHKCTEVVNAVGGNERTWKKVRKQWFSLKDKAKKLKGEMRRTGGGLKPFIPQSIHLCMEVMAKESLDGIRGKASEVDPTGNESADMSQESSQEEAPTLSAATTLFAAPTPSAAPTPTAAPTLSAAPTEFSPPFVAMTHKVQQLQARIDKMSSPTAQQRAAGIRQLQFHEEFLKLEKEKVELQRQALGVQRKMPAVMESHEARSLLIPMAVQ